MRSPLLPRTIDENRETPAEGMLAAFAAAPARQQAFNALLTHFRTNGKGSEMRTILVTSSLPDEGKTTTIVHLALARACTGGAVAVVEADLHRPGLHHHFGVPPRPGLADALLGRASVTDVVTSVSITAADRSCTIDVVPRGTTDLDSFLGVRESDLRTTLEAFGEGRDLVLIDSPPILATSDALSLAPVVDGTIFIVGAGQVKEHEAVQARQRLSQTGTNLLGVVMNRLPGDSPGGIYQPYSERYLAVE